LLLRLRALSGDAEPDVIGTVFSALLEVDRKEGIPFVSRFLDRDPEVAEEAAVALGLTHDEAALKCLNDRLAVERNGEVRGALLRGIALTRLPQAIDNLIAFVRSGSRDARAAVEALGYASLNEDARRRLADVVRASDNDEVKRAFEKLA
jgi:HEAT repeat protein